MKRMMKFFGFVSMMILISMTALASDNGLAWMTSSAGALKAYAKQNIRHAQLSVYSAGWVTLGSVNANDAQGNLGNLEKAIREQELVFSLADPSVDKVNLTLTVYDENWQPLFQGYNYVGLVKDKDGVWGLPDEAWNIEAALCYRIPLYIPNAQSARILQRDAQGNVANTQWLDTDWENGVIWFLSQYAGASGQMVVSTWTSGGGEKNSVYDLNEMAEVPVQDIKTSGSFSLQGVITITNDSSAVVVSPESSNGYGEVPLIEKTVAGPAWISVTLITTENEPALGISVRDSENDAADAWVYLPMVNGKALVPVDHACVIQIVPRFEKFGVPQVDQYGGGKG